MVLVTCPCLNIKISIKEPSLEFASDIDENSLSSEARSNRFFLGSKQVHLTSSGLQQEHEYLVQRQWVGGWWVHTCVVCDTHTYAMDPHSSDSSLVISPSLISDDAMVERLRNSYHYSPSFRCLLKDTTNVPQMSPTCSLDFVPCIQQEVTAYLMSEEAAMEDRVRKFEQAERTKFVEIQNRLKSDKKKLISLVLQNSKDNLNSQSPTKKSLAHSRSTPLHMDQKNMNQRSNQATDNNNRPPARHPDLLLDNDEELFHMEGNDETYAMSEDDGLDTDDSCAIEHSSSPTLFSTSVPVNVPAWRGKTSPPDWPERVTEEEGAPDIDQIHANIQALAKSVHDSSKEIFGDLPRPRMNTFCGRPSNR